MKNRITLAGVHTHTHTGSLSKIRKSKGITLITLIIIIVILLILAGVTITSITSENGIFNRAKQAKEESERSSAKETLEIELEDILLEKLGEKNLNYLDNININGYNVSLSNPGRIVTMTKNNVSYNFFVDDQYNVIDLNIKSTGNIGVNQGKTEDYIENLLFRVNFRELINNPSDVVKINGSGITVDETNTYATFDGKSGISIDGSVVDPENKLLGASDKSISFWYKKSNVTNEIPLIIRR